MDVKESTPISVPRSCTYWVKGSSATFTLCGFCDASLRAYAAVVYLVTETDVSTEVAFLVLVSPLQSQTIPRLELLSAFLLSKLITSVADSLSSTLPSLSLRCYTDSQVALYWIRGTMKEWKPFVSNRVKDIRGRVHPDHWSHCPGTSNPADLPSRGMTSLELSVNQLWRHGPEWLQMGFEPCVSNAVQEMSNECATEIKNVKSHSLISAQSSTAIEAVIEPTRYSTLSRSNCNGT